MATVDQLDDQKIHFGHILYFFFRKGLKPVEAQREIGVIYGDSVKSYDTCELWFACYRYDNGSMEDSDRLSRPIKTDFGHILSAITSNRHISTRQIGK